MSESKKIYDIWKSGEIELVKALLENIDYWQTDLLIKMIQKTNIYELIEMCTIKGYFYQFYYFETHKQIKKIRAEKFKELSFTDKIRASSFEWWYKLKRKYEFEKQIYF